MGNNKDSKSYSVRNLTEHDLEIFKAIRIHAIKEHSNVFLDTPEAVVRKRDAEWLLYFQGENKQIFGLFCDKNLVGIASVFQPDPTKPIGHMAMGYITEEHRSKGLSAHLYQARIDWAKQNTNFEALTISHRKGNEASRRAMLKFGFEYYGGEDEVFGDGLSATSLKYKLNLRP